MYLAHVYNSAGAVFAPVMSCRQQHSEVQHTDGQEPSLTMALAAPPELCRQGTFPEPDFPWAPDSWTTLVRKVLGLGLRKHLSEE